MVFCAIGCFEVNSFAEYNILQLVDITCRNDKDLSVLTNLWHGLRRFRNVRRHNQACCWNILIKLTHLNICLAWWKFTGQLLITRSLQFVKWRTVLELNIPSLNTNTVIPGLGIPVTKQDSNIYIYIYILVGWQLYSKMMADMCLGLISPRTLKGLTENFKWLSHE